MFKAFPGSDFIIDTAKQFLVSMHSTDELKEILRWQSNKLVQKIKGETVELEVHYKSNIIKMKSKKLFLPDEEDTVIMVVYKLLVMKNKYCFGINLIA